MNTRSRTATSSTQMIKFITKKQGTEIVDSAIDNKNTPSSKTLNRMNHNLNQKTPPIKQSFVNNTNSSTEYKSDENKSKNERKYQPKDQFEGKVNAGSISLEISKILKRLDDKKKKGIISSGNKPVSSKVNNSSNIRKQLFSAKEFGYRLQRDNSLKVTHYINLFELRDKFSDETKEISNYEILLAIVEIAVNSLYYKIGQKSKSVAFWEEIVKLEDMKVVLKDLKAETIKKYWCLIDKENKHEEFVNCLKKLKENLLENKKLK